MRWECFIFIGAKLDVRSVNVKEGEKLGGSVEKVFCRE
jgi:hypothetical protein